MDISFSLIYLPKSIFQELCQIICQKLLHPLASIVSLFVSDGISVPALVEAQACAVRKKSVLQSSPDERRVLRLYSFEMT